jgi:hypothetical protein
MEIEILAGAYNQALQLLLELSESDRLPDDYRELSQRIMLLVLEPDERHGHGEALSGYDEEQHRVFIAYYCAVGQLPHPVLASLALTHELAHILLSMDEGEAEQLTLRAARELGLDLADSVGDRRTEYSETKRIWDEGLFPYLGVLRNELSPEKAKALLREMEEKGFDLGV